MIVTLPDIEPDLEGTEIGKIRLLMRKLGIGNLSPAQLYSALNSVGLEIIAASPRFIICDCYFDPIRGVHVQCEACELIAFAKAGEPKIETEGEDDGGNVAVE